MKSTKTQEILNYVSENATETNNGLKLFFFTEFFGIMENENLYTLFEELL